MNEDVYDVSPTLGFSIKTIDFEEYALQTHLKSPTSSLIANVDTSSTYVGNWPSKSAPHHHSTQLMTETRGCGWAKEPANVLEELLREDGYVDLGS